MGTGNGTGLLVGMATHVTEVMNMAATLVTGSLHAEDIAAVPVFRQGPRRPAHIRQVKSSFVRFGRLHLPFSGSAISRGKILLPEYPQRLLQRLTGSIQPMDPDSLPLHAPEPGLLTLGKVVNGAVQLLEKVIPG